MFSFPKKQSSQGFETIVPSNAYYGKMDLQDILRPEEGLKDIKLKKAKSKMKKKRLKWKK
jgi:hypothetical protein